MSNIKTKEKGVKMKKIEGITLIALIITIIIMLILVSVTITLAINGGLFDYAGNAAQSTKAAYENESQLGTNSVNINNEEYTSIDDYLESLNREQYGLRSDGNFYVDPAAETNYFGTERIFEGSVYDSNHYRIGEGLSSSAVNGTEVFYDEIIYVSEDGSLDEEAFTPNGEFLFIYYYD